MTMISLIKAAKSHFVSENFSEMMVVGSGNLEGHPWMYIGIEVLPTISGGIVNRKYSLMESW